MFEAGKRTLGRRRCVSRRTGAPSTPPGVDPSTPLSKRSKTSSKDVL
jgi:hypothetical protein